MKTITTSNGNSLKPGESIKMKFPIELAKDQQEWILKKMNFTTGEIVKPGDIIGIIESKKLTFEFESYLHGKLEYTCSIGQKITADTILVEIKGVE
ncbi:biotin/lipoyl-containing protein [Aquimarina sp. 433]